MRMTGIAKAEAIRLALGLGVLGVTVTGLTTVATGAFFNSTTHATPKIVAGTVSLSTTPASSAFTFSKVAPGDINYGAVTVKNTGTLESRYALEATVNGAPTNLASQLQLDGVVLPADGTCDAVGFTRGTEVVPSRAVGTGQLFGDKTQGAQNGDRLLGAGASETLCFKVTLPSETGNAFQGKSAAMTFDFYSEQTANNS